MSFRPAWVIVTRRGFDGSRAWISIVGESCGYSVEENRSLTPDAFVPPTGWPSGSTAFTVERAAGVDLEVQRRRLGLGVEVDLGQDVVIADVAVCAARVRKRHGSLGSYPLIASAPTTPIAAHRRDAAGDDAAARQGDDLVPAVVLDGA